MEVISIILIIVAVGALNITCLFVGAKIGQTVAKGEKLEAPKIEPLKEIREHKNKRAAAAAQSRTDIILKNIETYDGTGRGQRDVPGR